jgi:uncharacterized lipoprotein YajG
MKIKYLHLTITLLVILVISACTASPTSLPEQNTTPVITEAPVVTEAPGCYRKTNRGAH